MPIVQIDKNGFIKGTNRKYAMKVITLQPIMIKGIYVSQGDKIELEGSDLAYFLSKNMVAPVKEDTVKTARHTLETETQPALVEGKKLGPKKGKKV